MGDKGPRWPGDVPDPKQFYAEIGQKGERPSDPVCATIYADWTDAKLAEHPRICHLSPNHDGLHQGPPATQYEIEQAARRNTQDSS